VILSHLNAFQIIVVPIVAALFVHSVYSLRRGFRTARVVGAAVWLVALVTLLRPETTMSLAKALGIGRGADLILYIFAVASSATAFYFYNRMVKLESSLTVIVRHLALTDQLATPAAESAIAARESDLSISHPVLEIQAS